MQEGTQLGEYRILGPIGAGGMGQVYRAQDTTLDREVAVKLLPDHYEPEQLTRFRREAKLLAAVNHPNICTIHGVGESEGRPYLVMELVKGETLAQRLSRGALPVPEALRVALEIARAIASAHRQGIVHRDLKPANVMITERGRVKVLDFGIAKPKHAVPEPTDTATEVATLVSELTQAGVRVGTAPYMSPEQVRGQPVDERSDVWAFGCVLYEMLTGRRAFGREAASDTLAAVLEGQPAWEELPERTPELVRALLRHCLSKDPDRRLHSIEDVRIELEDVTTGTGGGVVAPQSASAAGIRPAWVLGALALAALGVAVLQVAGTGPWSRGRDAAGPGLEAIGSVVALPSEVTAGEEDEFLAEAIPIAISDELAAVAGLRTKLPPTLDRFRGVGGDLGIVARAYEVDAFVMSSVRVQGSELHLRVRLVRASDQELLWSVGLEGRRDAYGELMGQAAEAIRGQLRPEAEPIALVAAEPRQSQAQLALSEGRFYANRYNNLRHDADRDLAAAALRRALELDAGLVDALSELAFLSVLASESAPELEKRDLLSDAAARAAVALREDPGNGLALVVISYVQEKQGRWREAADAALRAIVTTPELANAHVAFTFISADFVPTLAVAGNLHAAALDPLYQYSWVNAAAGLTILGRLDEASEMLAGVLAREPDMPVSLLMRSNALAVAGDGAEAEEVLSRAEAAGALAAFGFLAGIVDRLVQLDARLSRGEALDRAWLETLARDHLGGGEADLISVMTILARHREIDASFAVWDAIRGADHSIPYDAALLHPGIAPLREDPRFSDYAASARARFDEFMDLLRDARRRGELPAYLEQTASQLLGRLGLPPLG